MVSVDQIADKNVQQDDERRPKSREEKVGLLLAGVSLRKLRADISNEVEHSKCGQSDSGIQIRSSKMLQDVDHHLICRIASGESRNAHHGWHLSNADVKRRTSHEGADGGERNELNQPSKTCETKEANNGACDYGQG